MKVDIEVLCKLLATIRDSANSKAAGHGPILEAAIETIRQQAAALAKAEMATEILKTLEQKRGH